MKNTGDFILQTLSCSITLYNKLIIKKVKLTMNKIFKEITPDNKILDLQNITRYLYYKYKHVDTTKNILIPQRPS